MLTHRDDLGTGVVRAAATGLEQLLGSFERRHSKIGYLDVTLTVQQKVLGFKVTMTDVKAVAI
jgi:hypothetical protein